MGYILAFSMCAQPVGQSVYGVLFDRADNRIYLIVFATTIISVLIGIFSKRTFSNFEEDGKKVIIVNEERLNSI